MKLAVDSLHSETIKKLKFASIISLKSLSPLQLACCKVCLVSCKCVGLSCFGQFNKFL